MTVTINKNTEQSRCLLAVDGKAVYFPLPVAMRKIGALMNARVLDTVTLTRTGSQPDMLMLVDDQGHEKQLPVNHVATGMYQTLCPAGTVHEIRGAVFICSDSDFA